jgi:hypothetical protein
MKKRAIINLMLFTIFTLLFLSSCANTQTEANENNESIEDINTYTDEKFKFSVDYPQKWSTKTIKGSDSSAQVEALPDSGIEIFIENNQDEKIYVFGQNGHINIPYEDNAKEESFTTDSGLEGKIIFKDHNGKKDINLILGDGFIGVHANLTSTVYKEYEIQIKEIFKSIRNVK